MGTFHNKILNSFLLVSAFVTAANATPITITGVGLGRNASMLLNGSTTPGNHYAVEIMVNKAGTIFIAYCIDLFTSIGINTYNNTTGLPDSFTNGLRAAWLYNTYAPTVNTNDLGAAVQVALWDIAHDGGDGLGAGNIRLAATETSLRTVADGMITASLGHTSMNATILYNTSLTNGTPAQTLITAQAAYETPEPMTMALVGGALCLLARIGRRRRTEN